MGDQRGREGDQAGRHPAGVHRPRRRPGTSGSSAARARPTGPSSNWVVREGDWGSRTGRTRGRRSWAAIATIPTIESMKTIGVPARVRATKRTPSANSGVAPASSSAQIVSHTAAPMTAAPASARRHQAAPARRSAAAAPPRRPPGGVVEGDEVVADRHRHDRVEPRDPESRRLSRGRRELAGREEGRSASSSRPAASRARTPRRSAPSAATMPGRASATKRDHGHRLALDRDRHPDPDHPQEGEAGELVGAEEREAEHLAGEDVARQRRRSRWIAAITAPTRAIPVAACE